MRIPAIAVPVLIGLVAAGCVGSHAAPKPDSAAVAAKILAEWKADLRTAAVQDPGTRFPAPARAVLVARLRREAARYRLDVVRVRMLRPVQAAPLVVLQGSDEEAVACATPAILRAIDPKLPTGDDRTGWAYEGFFFEVLNEDRVPFLIVFNHLRGDSKGGGQWASRESLLPFAHG